VRQCLQFRPRLFKGNFGAAALMSHARCNDSLGTSPDQPSHLKYHYGGGLTEPYRPKGHDRARQSYLDETRPRRPRNGLRRPPIVLTPGRTSYNRFRRHQLLSSPIPVIFSDPPRQVRNSTHNSNRRNVQVRFAKFPGSHDTVI
jgi:hypothetical protein